jgi:RNA polymerase sigma-70 factor (ECF subfamily)
MKSLDQRREQKLIRQAAAGDREAAGTLIKLHQTSVYAYILRMSGRSDLAEDIVQEAFVRVLTNLDRFDPRYRFSTWLFTIARRVFLIHCERRKPISSSDTIAEISGRSCALSTSWDEQDEQEHTRDRVQAGLMTLSMEQREVIVLFYQHDWPIWLIAEHLEMPLGTVKSHLHRARSKLRDVLAESPSEKESEVVIVKDVRTSSAIDAAQRGVLS